VAKVLLVGESWFLYTMHQKGFDTMYTADYGEGADVFLDTVRQRGHDVTYVQSHKIHKVLPTTAEGFAEYDVVIISDVGANSFQLPPVTFEQSKPSPDKSELIREYVENGGSVIMIGGYYSFTGIDGKARWGQTPLADALPVSLLERDDRVELPAGATPSVVLDHPTVEGMDKEWPLILGLNEVKAKDGAVVAAECNGHPLLAVGEYGKGRSAAFMTDFAPHWATPEFLEWDGYAQLWDNLFAWLSKK